MYSEQINDIITVGLLITIVRLLIGWAYPLRVHQFWTLTLPVSGVIFYSLRALLLRDYDVFRPDDVSGVLAWSWLFISQGIAGVYQWWPDRSTEES